MTSVESLPPGSVDILTLSAAQLSSLQSRLSQELEHLTTSYTRLRSAQARFRDCINSVQTGVSGKPEGASLLELLLYCSAKILRTRGFPESRPKLPPLLPFHSTHAHASQQVPRSLSL
jgi:prefoldin alpha subunit